MSDTMMARDNVNPECWANKKRMVNPSSREFAFAYQFHEDIRVLYQLAYCGEESFRKHLAVLKSHIRIYEENQ